MIRTHINPDGTLQAWQVIGQIPGYLNSLATVAYGGNLYMLGGWSYGTYAYASVERAPINSDGSLGSWVDESTYMVRPRSGFPAVVANGYLYAIGGANSSDYPGIERAKIQADGSVGTWQVIVPGFQRRFHGAAVLGNYLYVVGGDNGVALNAVARAAINSGGSLGSFAALPSMNVPRFNLGVATNGGYLYAVGGRTSTTFYSSVEYLRTIPYTQYLPFVMR